MSEIPDVIYCNPERRTYRDARWNGKGHKIESPRYKYIRADIADQLAEALEYVAADMNDSMPIPSDVISRVTQALAAYRKAKGE